MIHANQLRRVGTLQTFEQTSTDEHGQAVGEWETVATVRVKKEPLAGRTTEYAHQLYELATHAFWLRYRSGVTAGQRLVISGQTYHFGYVENVDDGGRWLRILASEVPA